MSVCQKECQNFFKDFSRRERKKKENTVHKETGLAAGTFLSVQELLFRKTKQVIIGAGKNNVMCR